MCEKIRITIIKTGVEVQANREGLMGIADMCLRLAMLPENDQEAQKLGNHYHFAGYMDTAEEGSAELLITYRPEL